MNTLVVISYLTIFGLWVGSQFIVIPYVVHLLSLVTAILYVSCHASLVLREEPLAEGEEGYDPDAAKRETLKTEDAYQFPIFGSISLFSLYVALKYLDKDLVNLIIGGYFGVVGLGAITMTLAPLIEAILPASLTEKKLGWKYELKHPLPDWLVPSPLDLSLEFTSADVIASIKAAVIVGLYFREKHWALNNVLGICFCLQGIERFSLGTYKIGAILLVGLFFYDIFWVFGSESVFGSNVMVTVAKGLDGPIKILFPRSLTRNDEGKLDLSLLGLGDIVIPGFFLAILLRFDAHMANMPTHNIDVHAPFPKPYFHSALVGYFLGLCTTLFVMIQFNAAQPALLYLVPACLGSSFLVAVVKGQVSDLLAYSEEEEEEEEKEGDTAQQETTEAEAKKND